MGRVLTVACVTAIGCAAIAAAALALTQRDRRGADRARGTPGADRLVGRGGADTLRGARGADGLRGGGGDDVLRGGRGFDLLRGDNGDDALRGARGADVLRGGGGDDVLRGGPGRDSFNMRAGVELPAPGSDRIHARDGTNDEIGCGGGRDVAIVDRTEDGVYDCEVIRQP